MRDVWKLSICSSLDCVRGFWSDAYSNTVDLKLIAIYGNIN